MRHKLAVTIFIITYLFILINAASEDDFNEDLYIRPLADGKLFVNFKFTTLYRNSMKNVRWENKIHLFPLSLVDLIDKTDLSKLQFSLTKGNWNYRLWGYQSHSSPPGARIKAQFSKHNEDFKRSWLRLTNSLAGMFCTSLTSADKRALVSTKLAFDHSIPTNSSENVLYTNLPEETFCTENLTPWKKLLPCYANLGLASLLKPDNLLKSSYSSISIDLRPIACGGATTDIDSLNDDCEQVQLIQTVSAVFNPLKQFEGKQSWSLAKIFGRSIQGKCPLASHSRVHVDITELDDKSKLYPPNIYEEHTLYLKSVDKRSVGTRNYATYDINAIINGPSSNYASTFNLGIKQDQIFKRAPLSSRPNIPIYLRTHVAGVGAADGTIVATITNSLNEPVRVTYMDILPHYLRIYFHTLTIRTKSGHELKPDLVNFVLSKDEMPTLLEFSMILPPNSETQVSYDFERAFLRWTEFKPDANKGVLLGPAMMAISTQSALNHLVMPLGSSATQIKQNNDSSLEIVQYDEETLKIYARPLLVVLPTPDFTMSFNVNCLVFTVLVAAFGPILTITTKKPVIKVKKRPTKDAETTTEEPKKDQ